MVKVLFVGRVCGMKKKATSKKSHVANPRTTTYLVYSSETFSITC